VKPIPLREYVVSGMVSADTVNQLLAFGEPMLTETVVEEHVYGIGFNQVREYRAWIRLRNGGRTFGHLWHSTPQFAATALLEKLLWRQRGAK
jgi:hypothetical protein